MLRLQSYYSKTYDSHGNTISMPHLQAIVWDYSDRMLSASNGTFTSYYNYDNAGNRTRKVVDKGSIKEVRYYVGGYEVYRKYSNNVLDLERETLNIADDEKVFVREETSGSVVAIRYQYDNHLGSACLELDENGAIISYEEYHPFGTTSYRSGRSETEVSLKRYKYCGKERDEETGLYYYGARYYAGWIGRFVSVDPKFTEYPNISSYAYCANNPIKYIDPDGEDIWISIGNGEKVKWENGKLFNIDKSEYTGKNTFAAQTARALNEIMKHEESGKIVTELANNAEYNIDINKSTFFDNYETKSHVSISKFENKEMLNKNQSIAFNPSIGIRSVDNLDESFAPFVSLFHEFGHLYSAIKEFDVFLTRQRTPDTNWGKVEEFHNITTFEHPLAKYFGMFERQSYEKGNETFKTEGVLSKYPSINKLEPKTIDKIPLQ